MFEKMFLSENEKEQLFDLGRQYAQGDAVAQSYQEALALLKRAADQGHVKAQYNVGMFYHEGLGVEQSYEEAFKYFVLAADQGHDRANYMLGCYYAFGMYTQNDAKIGNVGEDKKQMIKSSTSSDERAADHFKIAADQGVAEAQYNYSVCLLNAKGVKKSEIEAIHYLELAVMQGNADAQYNLGICYLHGTAVPVSEHQAMHFFELAAKQKHPKALEALQE